LAFAAFFSLGAFAAFFPFGAISGRPMAVRKGPATRKTRAWDKRNHGTETDPHGTEKKMKGPNRDPIVDPNLAQTWPQLFAPNVAPNVATSSRETSRKTSRKQDKNPKYFKTSICIK
jgi:hypothetical protein